MDQAESLRQMLADRHAAPVRVIATTSGKGGVGKTNISSNLAVLAAKSGKRVLIVDADLGLANVEIIYGITPKYHLGDLLDGKVTMEEVLATGPGGIRVLPAGSGVSSLTQLDDAQKLRLMTGLDAVEDAFDVVIIDTGAGIGENVRFFVGGAQEALLVVTPEPTSLTDAYASVKVLSLGKLSNYSLSNYQLLSISLIFLSVSSSSIRIESFSIRICMMRRRSDCGASGASGSTKSGTSAREYTPANSGILP